MWITVSKEKGGYFVVKPQTNSLQVPTYDENEGYLEIPESDFNDLKAAQHCAEDSVSRWSQNREAVVKQLLEMAFDLDGVQFKCNISTTLGSSVGIASGAAVIGGMILMPAVAVGGLIVGAAAATSNLVTGIIKLTVTKKRAHQAKILLEEDKALLDSVVAAIDTLQIALANVINNSGQFDLPETNNTGNAIAAIECTANVVMCGAKFALREAAAVSSNVLKGVVHAAAGIGIALDLVTVILTAKSLVTGSRSELAAQLREVAERIEIERMELHRTFIYHVSLAN